MTARTLTLAQQKICALHPSQIGISPETLATINSLRDEQWSEESPHVLYNTHACPFAGIGCRFMGITCVAITNFDDLEDTGIEEDDEAVMGDSPSPVTAEEISPSPLAILRVSCLLSLDLKNLGLPTPNETEVVQALAKYDLACGPDIEWIPQRILTIKMQRLLECGLTDIGVAVRDAEQIEKYTKIHTLNELLQLHWDDFQRLALPKDAGGIPNFGKGALRDIEACLQRHGFCQPPGTVWIREQDTKEYIDRNMAKYLGSRKRK